MYISPCNRIAALHQYLKKREFLNISDLCDFAQEPTFIIAPSLNECNKLCAVLPSSHFSRGRRTVCKTFAASSFSAREFISLTDFQMYAELLRDN